MTKYFTSDWHLNEIRLNNNAPIFRPFNSVEEQNNTIINNINKIVQPNDELYHLGDVSMDLAGIELLDKIKCQNKILIIGNYDENKLSKLSQYFEVIKHYMDLDVQGLNCYLNHYPINNVKDKFNITGHIHGLWKVKPNMVNVGVDAWHFKPVSEDNIIFIQNAIENYYDENVFVGCKK